MASLFTLNADAATALGIVYTSSFQKIHWLGCRQALPVWLGDSSLWVEKTLPHDRETVVKLLALSGGEDVCLLDSGLALVEGLEDLPSWVVDLASHPKRDRLAWVGSEDTLSVIPVLLASGIPRYLNTADVLAPLLLSDWLERWDLAGTCNVQAVFPAGKAIEAQKSWTVDSSKALEQVVCDVMSQCLEWKTQSLSELQTCLLEALNNALYHAPVTNEGQPKYAKHSCLEALPTCDQVKVTMYRVDGWVVVAIKDHWGRLTPERLLQGLYHQTTDDGLLDEDGRGMLLMHLLPQGWANFCVPNQQLTTVFIHPTDALPPLDTNPARSFWFV